MAVKEKKVMIFIVEGPSDESAIGTVIKEYFSSAEVKFYVVHGDITVKDRADHGTILKRINTCIDEIQRRYRYEDGDIIRIVHLTDLDGAFADDQVIQKKEAGPTEYYPDHIVTTDVEALEKRNRTKAELLYKLSSTGKIRGIPYRIYYMSCNLEHVLYNELREFSDSEKWERSDRFAERFEGNVGEFISMISNGEVAVDGSYRETWKFIEKGEHSLERYTNFQQVFSSP